MPDLFKTIKVTQPNLGGPLQEALVGAVQASGGAVDAGKVVVLDASGAIDPSMTGGGSTSFTNITTGPNTTATMTVGSGATLTFSGTGVVNASELGGVAITNTPTHLGQLPIVSNLSPLQMNYADPQVQGLYDAGSPISPAPAYAAPTNIQPVLIGGSDGSTLRNILTDSSGRQIVNVNGSVTVSGTVAVTQSTSPWVVAGTQSDNTTNSTAKLPVLGARANASAPTWTEGFQVPLSTDLSGNLRVTTVGGGSSTQYAEGSTVATATGTVALGKNYGTNIVSSLQLDGSNNLDVNVQNAIYTAISGNAVPSRTAWIAASDGTNLQGLLVESSTNKNLRVAIYNGSSELTLTGSSLNANITNATSGSPLFVQDVSDVTAGTTTAPTKILVIGGKTADGTPAYDPLPLIAGGAAVSVQSTHDYTQGSTTSGQLGPLVQGAVSASDPSYTTGQTDPLSMTLQGHLRTQDYAEANANGSTSVPNNAMFIGAKGADGFLHGLSSSTNDGKLDVNASFSGSVTTSFIADRIQSGAITSTQTVVVSTQGAASVVFNITGTWTGTIQFQAQLADNSWVTATAYPVFTGGVSVTQTTANGQWQLPCGGLQAFRVIGNTVSSGTATANLEAGAGSFSSFVEQLTATNLNATVTGTVTSNQGGAPWSMVGTLSNNNAAPTNDNVGVLPALVVSGAQAWTAGRQSLLTVSTGGYLLTEDLSDGLVNTASQPTTAIQVAGWDGSNLRALSTTSNGFLNVNASISGSFTPALTSDATATGTITSTQNVFVSTQGTGTTQFNVTGSWTGTLVFEGSIDGTNFVAAKVISRYPTSLPPVNSTTTNGQWSFASGGLNKFRVRGNTVATGTATIWIEAGAGSQDMQTLAMIFDPSTGNTPVVVGPSATPTTSNNALVVALSPNSALTTTTVPTTSTEALVVALSPNSAQFATSTTANALPGSNPQTIGVSSSAVVNANASRKEVTIVNTGTTYIYLGLGQTPTTTAYHIALAKCTAANDGTGGTWTSDMWKGAVNAISSGAGGTVNLTELT